MGATYSVGQPRPTFTLFGIPFWSGPGWGSSTTYIIEHDHDHYVPSIGSPNTPSSISPNLGFSGNSGSGNSSFSGGKTRKQRRHRKATRKATRKVTRKSKGRK